MVYCKCVVKGCTTTSFKKTLALFDVPTNEALFVKWQEKIETNDGQPLKADSKVCELHFLPRSIRKEIVSHRNYKNSVRSVLSKNAIPLLNLVAVVDKKCDDAATSGLEISTTVTSDDAKTEATETTESVEAERISVEDFIAETAGTIAEPTKVQEENNATEMSETVSAEVADNAQIVEGELVLEQVPVTNNIKVDGEAPEGLTPTPEVTLTPEEVAPMPEEVTSTTEEVTPATEEKSSDVAQDIATAIREEESEESLEGTIAAAPEDEPLNSPQETITPASEEKPEKSTEEITTAADEGEPVKLPQDTVVPASEEKPLNSQQEEAVTLVLEEEPSNLPQEEAVTLVLEEEPGSMTQEVSDNAEMTLDAVMTSPAKKEDVESDATMQDLSVNAADPANMNLKDAATEAGKLDVLVCGNCHTVFHFIEDFQTHKNAAACNDTSSLKSNITEPKPQVWAFLIWKNSQIEDGSSWKLYQRWCQMSDTEKKVWIDAGARLQECAALSRLKYIPKETSEKVIPNKAVPKSPRKGQFPTARSVLPISDTKKTADASVAESVEAVNNLKSNFESEGEIYSSGIEDGDSSAHKPEAIETIKPIHIKEEVTSDAEEVNTRSGKLRKPLKPAKSGTAADDEDEESDEEYSVERIVARRYNSKKKQFEYLLKWEGYPPDQNTWEPAENLATCQHLLKAYEANLAKMQQNHKNAKAVVTPVLKKESDKGRPTRNSKQRALSQVKQWCGVESGKRRGSDSTDDEGPSSNKKIKMERYEPFNPSKSINRNDANRSFTKLLVNGVPERKQVLSRLAAELGIGSDDDHSPTKTGANLKPLVRSISSLSQQNQEVLVASAKGVVKVDPSQVPNLSSGVYIMSNKSGIIKLDSLSPQKALSSLRKTGVLPQTSRGGVVVLQTPTQKGMPRSGIVPKNQIPQKVQESLPFVSKVPVQRPIQPKSMTSSSVRPPGLLRPSGTSTPRPLRPVVPRIPSISTTRPPPLSKIQFPALRPKGVQAVGRPLLPSLKDKVKPIQSILGSALLASEDKVAALKAKTNIAQTSQNIAMKPVSQTPKLGLLKKPVAKISKLPPLQGGAKLVENDKLLMEFRHHSDSDSDYGLEDTFPADLPPIASVEDSPPRPLTLDPETGERLMKAEGERTPSPEPTPPPTPPPKTPEPALSSESTDTTETIELATEHSNQPTFIKVEMSPGGTTGMVTEASSASQEEALEFGAVGDECDVSGLRVKKILSPTSELEHQRIVLAQEGETPMEGVESEETQVEDSIIHVTGEDGTVYQVSSSQLNGDTLLLDGVDGPQQCVFVTEDGGEISLDPSQYADAVSQLEPEQMESLANSNTITIESEDTEDTAQVVAQLVEAGEPCGGGLRRVVLMLPDGNLMMTEVDEEQFAALELDK